MANIIGIEVSGDTYNLEDSQARQGTQTNAQDIDGIEGVIPSSASSSNLLLSKSDVFTRGESRTLPITLKSGYSASLATLLNVTKRGNITCADVVISDIGGDNIGTTFTALIGSCSLRPIVTTQAVLIEYNSQKPTRLEISPSGNISILESGGITSGTNAIRGVIWLFEE